jgi:hypothetical protein
VCSAAAPPAVDARGRLAASLLLLSGVELGHVFGVLERKAPGCLEEVGGVRDKVEINLDLLDAAVLSEISAFASERASFRKRSASGGAAAPSVTIEDISNRRKKKK